MKTGVILAFRFLDPSLYLVRSIIILVVALTMYCVVLYYFPFYNPIINQMRAGFFASTAGVGIVSLVACITYSVTGNTQGEYVMIVMISALILFFGVGFWFAGYVLTRIQARARAYLDEYRDPKNPRRMLIPMPTNAKEPIVFLLWPHVEIAARFITRNMDERSRAFNKNQIPDMVCLFTQGLKEFPKHPIVRICYGNYYFLLTGEKEIPSKQYAILAKSKVPYDVAFQIYFNRQIVNQTTDKKVLGLGSILNLANFAEMQKTEMDAKVHHYLSVQETRTMWKLLLNKNFRMEELLNVTARVYTYSHLAHENYLKLIFKHPKSSLYVRYYARFCYDVTGDAAKAKELSDKADLLDERRTGTLRESELHKKEITRSIASSIGQSTYGRIAAIVIQKKRLKHVVKLGGILRIVIGITIGIIISIAIVTYIIVSSLLTDLNAFSGNLVRLHAIEFMIAMESRRLRQIQNAHNVNDSLYFDDRRSLMFLEMQNFSSVSEAFFLNRDQTSASIESWFIDTKIQTINSHFPASSNRTSLNLTFHDYTEQFVICGLSIANTSFPGFTNSSYRDDVRFLLDNSLTAIAQVIDPLFQTALIPSLNNKTKEAILKIYALTCCEIFIICLGLTLKDITSFYLTKSQKQSLKILGEVPKYAVQNLLDDLEDADSDGLFSDNIIQSSDQYKTRITPIMSIIIYHLQSKFFCFCAISLAVVMACINLKNIFLVGQNFGIYNAAGDIATSTIRVYNRAYEILHFDPLTDISKETLVDQLIARTSLLENSLYRVQYGDVNFNPSTPSYDTFPMDLYYPLMLEKCLPYNKSQCLAENRHFNESIGYTGVLLDSGLMKMTHAYTNFAIDLSSSGTFGPSGASKVSLMDKLLEPDLVQGWLTFENAVLVSTNKLVSATNISTMIIFILQVVFLNIAFMAQQMYLTWRESRFR
ncbi:hypothetical protein BC830DRAFT_212137 [Chytriomyces sp. MP71]|nr:hypothetical protein BC830DRAFT_212137 [Chytriomyces sp. MP71]